MNKVLFAAVDDGAADVQVIERAGKKGARRL
jgi:hypothetical protein